MSTGKFLDLREKTTMKPLPLKEKAPVTHAVTRANHIVVFSALKAGEI